MCVFGKIDSVAYAESLLAHLIRTRSKKTQNLEGIKSSRTPFKFIYVVMLQFHYMSVAAGSDLGVARSGVLDRVSF